MDYDRVAAGYDFVAQHGKFAEQVMGMSSLAATFAAKDITPTLMQTGRLPKDFTQRMKETGQWIDKILDIPKDRADFTGREYMRAVELGQLHASVADSIRKSLNWDPKQRVPINGQSFAFVLYTFAYWPIEAMITTKQIDPVKDAKEIDAWFYLWSVIGYGMGAPDDLLPRTFARAKEIVPLLRKAQYTTETPAGIPILLGGQVRMIADQIAATSKATPEQAMSGAVKALGGLLMISPGECAALGLKDLPFAQLKQYAAVPPPK